MAAYRNAAGVWKMICIGPTCLPPGAFAQLASGYRAKHKVNKDDLKRAMAHVSVKSHANGAKNPKAHLQREITEEQAINAPFIAEPIGLFDCCGVSDGSACAIVTTPEIAKSLGKENLVGGEGIAAGGIQRYRIQSRQLGWLLFKDHPHCLPACLR
jgi:acetyl-CoA C-acetyltransferase